MSDRQRHPLDWECFAAEGLGAILGSFLALALGVSMVAGLAVGAIIGGVIYLLFGREDAQ